MSTNEFEFEIVKRDGRRVAFDKEKITEAIFKAVQSVGGTDRDQASKICASVVTSLVDDGKDAYTVEEVQDRVEKELIESGHAKTAKAYILYRERRSNARNMRSSLTKQIEELIFKSAEEIEDKRENANIDGDSMCGTIMKVYDAVMTKFNMQHMYPEKYQQLHYSGRVHNHDANLSSTAVNCLYIPLDKLLERGFSTGHGSLRSPSTIQSAATLSCIVIQSDQNDQFGGQGIPFFDHALRPYVAKSYIRNCAEYLKCKYVTGEPEADRRISDFIKKEFIEPLDQYVRDEGKIMTEDGRRYITTRIHEVLKHPDIVLMTENQAHLNWVHDGRELPLLFSYANTKTDRDTYQAMEAFIHNMCTLNSRSGGQCPFSSINFGTDTTEEGRMIIKNVLMATDAGLGNGETAIFPISIFKMKKGITDKGSPNYDLFQLACRVSSRRLFPNFLNISSSFNEPYYREGRPETEVASMGLLKEGQIKLQYLPKGEDKYVIEKMDISDVGHWVHEHIPEAELIKYDEYTHWMNLEPYKVYIWDEFGDAWTQVRKWLRSYDPRRKWLKITFKHTFLGAHRPPQFTITCTTDHPLPIMRDNEWTRVKGRDFKVGDVVYGNKQRHQTIEKIEPLEESEVGYDFQTVSDRFSVDKVVSFNCRTRVMGNVHNPDKQIAYGRGNLFPITINLPFIALETREALGDNATQEELIEEFFKRLEARQKEVFDMLEMRFEFIAKRKARNFPFLMGQHLYMDSEKLNPDDEIREVLKNGTLTSGFIGLAETLVVLTGKHHGESEESQALGLKIVGFLNDMNVKKSEEMKMNFTLMGSPAEGCTGRLLNLTRKRFGVIKGVTDHEFFTNSSHIPVYFKIPAYKKVELEAPYHKMCPAGAISYVELNSDASTNPEAFERLVTFMADSDMGYFSINHPVDRDPICGYVGIIGDTCPRCGRRDGEGVPAHKLMSLLTYNPDPAYAVRYDSDEAEGETLTHSID